MTLERLLAALRTFPGTDWLIRQTTVRRLESYNIGCRNEMEREVRTVTLALTLYVDFNEEGKSYRGSYVMEVRPGWSGEELRKAIAEGIFAAGFVKNPRYPLVEPAGSQTEAGDRSGKERLPDLARCLADLQDAFHSVRPESGNGRISYSEFFLTDGRVRILNSRGVDAAFSSRTLYAETAVHVGPQDGETEIFESYGMSVEDPLRAAEILKERLAALFAVAEQKFHAEKNRAEGKVNILLSGECLARFFGYFRTCTDAQMIYQKLSPLEPGRPVQEGGDPITLTLEPELPGSSLSRPFDEDGLALKPRTPIRDGKFLEICGNTRFAGYLGIAPSGAIANIHVTGGTASVEELKKEPYLELVSFSDFQMNPITGDFGSEIRLGFFFDGTATVPVTGGSISGSMAEAMKGLRMSRQERQYDNFLGPETVCVKGVSVGGCA